MIWLWRKGARIIVPTFTTWWRNTCMFHISYRNVVLTCRWRRRAVVCTSSSVICARSTTCIASVWQRSLASSNELCTSNRYIQLMVLIQCWTHFIHPFSTIIQMGRKFLHTFIQILMNWSLQIFAHVTTAQLSCHVQKFAVIWMGSQWNKFSIELELWWKGVCEVEPSSWYNMLMVLCTVEIGNGITNNIGQTSNSQEKPRISPSPVDHEYL